LSDAVWPISLPTAPLLRGLTEKRPDLTTRFSTDVGPAKVRARGTVGVTTFPCELLLTGTLVTTFDAFFYTTLAGGALTFDWTHPRLGTTVSFRFVGPPEYTPAAPRQAGAERYRVKFTLEIVPSADAVVIGGGGGDPPEGGAWFQPPWTPPTVTAPEYDTVDWGGAGVFEDPPAAPDGLLWQVGAGDEGSGAAGGFGDEGSGAGLDGGGDGGGANHVPFSGSGSASGAGDGTIGSHDGTGAGGVIIGGA